MPVPQQMQRSRFVADNMIKDPDFLLYIDMIKELLGGQEQKVLRLTDDQGSHTATTLELVYGHLIKAHAGQAALPEDTGIDWLL